ncbi:MAG: HAD-IIIA family hydrolase [Nanoarchaeota archaeon]|nr:HAD-IIIA family hydrolase [Nanoarchaeota archaeon]
MNLNKKVVILLDRDGTINKDKNYYLGSADNWKQQLEFLPGVVEGLRLLNQILNFHVFIVTNQSGVSLDIFPNFTEERMHEVNEYIIQELTKQGVRIDFYFACPFVDNAYVEKSKLKGRTLNHKYIINNHPDLKPNTGMADKALAYLNLKKEDCSLFMVGDRYFDMVFAKNIDAFGILVESHKTRELGDTERIKQMGFYVAKDFLDAVKKIQEKVNNQN